MSSHPASPRVPEEESPSRQRRLKKRGVCLATGGLLLALLLGLGLKLTGRADVSLEAWSLALGLTLLLQGLLWWIPHRGWDARLSWDPHYLYLPTIVALAQLDIYVYLFPEARGLVFIAFFVSLLFMAGLAGIREVLILTSFLVLGYFTVIAFLARRGEDVSLPVEIALICLMTLTGIYAGFVLETLRRERLEKTRLRRQLARLAATDPLTGLPNRRQFQRLLDGEIERIRRYGGSCAVSMLDVDHFKNYNDSLGHLAGDEILKELAELLRSQLRDSDLAARYGGEEFAVVMINTSRREALLVIERLRRTIERHPFKDQTVQPGALLTISAGVAVCPEDGASYQEVVAAADRALYEAKQRGRNRVCCAAAA